MSVVRALVTTSKVANYAEFTWGRAKFQKVVGLSEKERSNIKRDRTPLLTMPPTSNHYEETGYFASLSGLVLFYRRWKDEEKEP